MRESWKWKVFLENDDTDGHRSEDSLPMCSENAVEGSILYVQ